MSSTATRRPPANPAGGRRRTPPSSPNPPSSATSSTTPARPPANHPHTPARRRPRPAAPTSAPPGIPVPAPGGALSTAAAYAPRKAADLAGRAFSPTGADQALGRPVGKLLHAGDGGGLLLALVVYPIVLATLKYGTRGPGIWFRAKWLNEDATGKHFPGKIANAGGPAVRHFPGGVSPKNTRHA